MIYSDLRQFVDEIDLADETENLGLVVNATDDEVYDGLLRGSVRLQSGEEVFLNVILWHIYLEAESEGRIFVGHADPTYRGAALDFYATSKDWGQGGILAKRKAGRELGVANMLTTDFEAFDIEPKNARVSAQEFQRVLDSFLGSLIAWYRTSLGSEGVANRLGAVVLWE